MALRDVKEYYYTVQAQYITMKDDLADFEQALSDGYITEDQLETIKSDLAAVETNYNRLSYIMFLFGIPHRKKKQPKHLKLNQKLVNGFAELQADKTAVEQENKDIMKHFKEELKRLSTKETK